MPEPKSDATRKFGEALKAARNQASQQNVADAAFIHVSNYGEYERGETEIGLHMLFRLAHVLGTTVEQLLHGIEEADVPDITELQTAIEVREDRQAQRRRMRRA